MINTLRNFASTHHLSGGKLNFDIMPGIFFLFTLALLNLVLITFTLATAILVIFTLILFILINIILIKPVIISFCSRISAVVDSLKTVFFEGVL